jgi:hypothetical protein
MIVCSGSTTGAIAHASGNALGIVITDFNPILQKGELF